MNIKEVKRFLNSAYEEEVFDVIQLCAQRLGWSIGIEEGQEIVRGITLGTPEYMDAYFKQDSE